ncbi:RpiB/LacA/LacB family sugar-phosphate isomerase, partial [bacterium]|nr:RpiB/LacA/LacB family sugar-phosphate isomerase [bacterium]
EDHGAFVLDPNDDYTDFIEPVANIVSQLGGDANVMRGIVIGGSGQGEAMLANRFPHVRAMVFNGQYEPAMDGGGVRQIPDEIFLSRDHNDANILALGARFLNEEEAKEAIQKWLETPFSGDDRHKRRLEKIEHATRRVHMAWRK